MMIEGLALALAVVGNSAARPPQTMDLLKVEAAAEEATGRPVFLMRISRTGRYVAYVADDDYQLFLPDREVFVLDRSTGVTRRAGEAAYEWQWAAEDDTLWLLGRESLFRYDAQSGTSQRVALPEGMDAIVSVAAWSGDRAVALVRSGGPDAEDFRKTVCELAVGPGGAAAPVALKTLPVEEAQWLLALPHGEWIAWDMAGALHRGFRDASSEALPRRAARIVGVERIDDSNAGVVYQSDDGNVALTVVPPSGPPEDLGWTDKTCGFKNLDTAYILTALAIRRDADGYEVLLSRRALPELPRSIHFSDHGVCADRPPLRGDEPGTR